MVLKTGKEAREVDLLDGHRLELKTDNLPKYAKCIDAPELE